jgi:hypothetical protein
LLARPPTPNELTPVSTISAPGEGFLRILQLIRLTDAGNASCKPGRMRLVLTLWMMSPFRWWRRGTRRGRCRRATRPARRHHPRPENGHSRHGWAGDLCWRVRMTGTSRLVPFSRVILGILPGRRCRETSPQARLASEMERCTFDRQEVPTMSSSTTVDERYLLGIDFGTESCRAGVFDSAGGAWRWGPRPTGSSIHDLGGPSRTRPSGGRPSSSWSAKRCVPLGWAATRSRRSAWTRPHALSSGSTARGDICARRSCG